MISCIALCQMVQTCTVARDKKSEYSKTKEFIKNSLGIDLMVNPEFEAAKQIVYMLTSYSYKSREFFLLINLIF